MTGYAQRVRATPHEVRIRRQRIAGLLVLAAALVAVSVGGRASSASSGSSSSTAGASPRLPRGERPGLPGEGGGPASTGRLGLGEADGAVPDHTTVFDDEVPGVARLNADLLAALRRAATDAAQDGIGFVVGSGWRSPEYQRRLLREAIAKYGSEAEAARWVATPETSAHVTGDAVDVGPSGAAAWLAERGAAYGLCRVYDNEPWHYELRPDAVERGCPATYPDPTHDPRMRQE